MNTEIKKLGDALTGGVSALEGWDARIIRSDECVSYVVWNSKTREALLIDPKIEDIAAYLDLASSSLKDYLWLGVVDTHTHADHISCGVDVAEKLGAPYIMSEKAPSPRVHIRVSSLRQSRLPAHAGAIEFIPTPGHTPDSLTVIWGPFIFGGDTVLFGDVGRDDLPGGNPEAHYESLLLLKKFAKDEMILLPGHDHKGGRISTWQEQMKINSSLTQERESFIKEAAAFDAPAPALLKKSLRENFK